MAGRETCMKNPLGKILNAFGVKTAMVALGVLLLAAFACFIAWLSANEQVANEFLIRLGHVLPQAIMPVGVSVGAVLGLAIFGLIVRLLRQCGLLAKFFTALTAVCLSMAVMIYAAAWFADQEKIMDVLSGALKTILSPDVTVTAILVGFATWFVMRYSKEISALILRIETAGPVTFSSQDQRPEFKVGKRDSGDSAENIRVKIEKDAQKGNPKAQYDLGVIYALGGKDVIVDNHKALEWLNKAVDQKYPKAMCGLGTMYAEGRGVERNPERAVKLFTAAAEAGVAEAQYNLGVAHSHGVGVRRSNEEAAMWYHRAAEQGFAHAQYNLGLLCVRGQGIPKNPDEGIRWLHQAATRGHFPAQMELGALYYNGEEVKRNLYLAYVWCAIAASGHDSEAYRRRNSAGRLLSSSELVEANADAQRRLDEIRRQQEKESGE